MNRNNKLSKIICGVIMGLLSASTITFAALYLSKPKDNNQEQVTFSPMVLGGCSDSSLIGDKETYVQINNTKYYYSLTLPYHQLECDYQVVGGETISIHTTCNADIKVYSITVGQILLSHDSDFGGETDYSFTAEANTSYHIDIAFADL